MSAGRRASARLLDDRDDLARALTARLYEALPELHGKYGEAGREHCLQDMRYNLEHLAPAVDLEEPGMYAKYVRWLDGLLTVRGIDTAEVVRTLELMDALVRERFDGDEAAAASSCIRAGLAELRRDAPT